MRKSPLAVLMIWGTVLAFGGVAYAINHFAVPLVSALLWALLLGVAVTNAFPTPRLALLKPAAKFCLRLGIVGLGLQLSAAEVAETGFVGVAIILSTVAATYFLTLWVGPRLGINRELVTLIAAGFAVCGAAAIAAVQDAVKAKERDVASALALVTLFGTLMIILVPTLTTSLGLTEAQGAVWAGASIHEVAQVVAAASIIGAAAVPIASAIKLGRVLMLAPVFVHANRQHTAPGDTRVSVVPWFVVGFLAMFALRWTGLPSPEVVDASKVITTVLLSAGMFGLGLDIRVRELLKITPHAVTLSAIATLTALLVSGVQVLAFM